MSDKLNKDDGFYSEISKLNFGNKPWNIIQSGTGMSLQTELETIINSVAAGVYLAGQADEPCGADDTVEALQAILATLQTAVLAAAPEKLDLRDEQLKKAYDLGYNQAVTDYTKALQQLFESEGE